MNDSAVHDLHQEAAELDRLIDSVWPADVPRCKHKHATMVQAMHQELGWFVTWQCDDCGIPLADRPVTAEDIERGETLPWLDKALLMRHLEQLERRPAVVQMFFGSKAA